MTPSSPSALGSPSVYAATPFRSFLQRSIWSGREMSESVPFCGFNCDINCDTVPPERNGEKHITSEASFASFFMRSRVSWDTSRNSTLPSDTSRNSTLPSTPKSTSFSSHSRRLILHPSLHPLTVSGLHSFLHPLTISGKCFSKNPLTVLPNSVPVLLPSLSSLSNTDVMFSSSAAVRFALVTTTR